MRLLSRDFFRGHEMSECDITDVCHLVQHSGFRLLNNILYQAVQKALLT